MWMVDGPSSSKRFLEEGGDESLCAGVAEVVKGAGLKIRSRMGSWVRIPPPAPFFLPSEPAGGRTLDAKRFNTPLGHTKPVDTMRGDFILPTRPARAVALVVLLLLSVLSSIAVDDRPVVLDEEGSVQAVRANQQTYELFLDAPVAEFGGDGSIVTNEPDGGQEEGSAVDGLEFRSTEMISDLYINGSGSGNTVRLSVYYQFRGSDGSTADMTFALKSGDVQIDSQSRELDSPCSSINPNSGCSWAIIEVEFDVGAEGFRVAQGKQIKVRIDAQPTCDQSSGGPLSPDCDVQIAFGRVGGTNSYSRLQVYTNALTGSSVRVHSCHPDFGCNWNDAEKVTWSPNHRPEYREMQFSVEVRDAFGRDDIEEIQLILDTPNRANVVFENEFDDDDLRLDNNGLVGNYSFTYTPGIAAGEYPLRLQVEDVQGHTVVFEHPGITFLEHDVHLTLPSNQPDVVLFAPGATVSIEFLLEHTGSSSSSLEVVFDLSTNLPSEWSDPLWSVPSKTYALSSGGQSLRPQLDIEVPEGDVTFAPDSLEITARVYAENDLGQMEEVAIKTVDLGFEEVDVYAPPRLFAYEDVEHQIQIADSTRPDAYDETLSHYVDAEEIGDFFLDVFNTGFITDAFKIRVLEQPDDWQYRFYDNDTGMELTEEGIYSITPDIGSTQILTVRMEVYPPADRESEDIGLFSISVTSQEDSELRTDVAFTVHRTFGILVEVISDSDGVGENNPLGQVGPVGPGASVFYNLRVTDSSEGAGQTTWRIINPRDVDRNTDANSKYGSWDYTLSNGSNSNIVVVQLAPDQYADMRLDITIQGQMEAGDHTIYTRIIEEGVDVDEARYFDLPVKVVIREDVVENRIEITDKTEKSRFAPGEEQNLDFRVSNQNNIALDVVIRLDQPEGWEGNIRATSSQLGSDFLILNLPAYAYRDFSVTMVAPESVKDSEQVAFELRVTPMDNETPYGEGYNQVFTFNYLTECNGLSCLVGELINPEPQTIGFYVMLVALLGYALRRKPAAGEVYEEHEAKSFDDAELEGAEEEDDDLPPPVTATFDDDDLELLDELDDL